MADLTSFAEFPARFYLEKYYSSVGAENAAFMRAAACSVRESERLGVVVELGGGPSLCALFAMAAGAGAGPSRVVWVDVAASGTGEVEDWLRGTRGAFEYTAVLSWLEEEFDVDSFELARRVRDAEWDIRHLDLRRPLPRDLHGLGDVVGSHFLAEAATGDEERFVEMTRRVGQAASPGALVALSYVRRSRPYRLDDETLYPAFSVDEDNLAPLLTRAGLEFAELRIERGPMDDPPARPGYEGMVFATGRLAPPRSTGTKDVLFPLNEIVVEFLDREPRGVDELAESHPDEVEMVTAKGFGAFDFTVQLLAILSPTVTVQLARVIKAHIESKGRVKIKVDGVQIEGVSVEQALRVLDEVRDRKPGEFGPDEGA